MIQFIVYKYSIITKGYCLEISLLIMTYRVMQKLSLLTIESESQKYVYDYMKNSDFLQSIGKVCNDLKRKEIDSFQFGGAIIIKTPSNEQYLELRVRNGSMGYINNVKKSEANIGHFAELKLGYNDYSICSTGS